MAQAEQVHVSSWPAVWPTRTMHAKKDEGGKQGSAPPNYDNLAANRMRAAAHCFEAKCFGIACSGHLGHDAVQAVVEGAGRPDGVAETLRAMPRAATFFLDPTGAAMQGFVYEEGSDVARPMAHLQNEEGILYADMDLDACVEGKQYHDVVGGYQRLDVFDLKVDRSRKEPVRFVDEVE